MTALDVFSLVALAGSILLCAWWALDRIEDRNAAALARLDSEIRARRRMGAVVMMGDRRKP